MLLRLKSYSIVSIFIFCFVLLLGLVHSQPAQAASQPLSAASCNIQVEIIAAPFAVVDSNMPGVQVPN